MPKMKTRKGVKKRYRSNATGKLRHGQAFRRHILASKSTKRKRNLRKNKGVYKAYEKKLRWMLVN